MNMACPNNYRLKKINDVFPFSMNIDVCYRVLFHDYGMHEYAYLGSPLFNLSGDLLGITFLNQGNWQAWTVWQLRDTFKNWKR
jgi:hypothetical protein